MILRVCDIRAIMAHHVIFVNDSLHEEVIDISRQIFFGREVHHQFVFLLARTLVTLDS